MELFEKSRREYEFGWGPSSAQGRVAAYKTPKAFDILKTRRANCNIVEFVCRKQGS